VLLQGTGALGQSWEYLLDGTASNTRRQFSTKFHKVWTGRRLMLIIRPRSVMKSEL
jgi:hypothetical protein